MSAHPAAGFVATLTAAGATATARDGAPAIARFDPTGDEDLRATQAAISPLTWRRHILATGKHRDRFLHNMTTCQVKKLSVGDTNHGMVVDQGGKLVGRFVIDVRDEDMVLELDEGRRDAVLAQLRRYIVADRVAFDPTECGLVLTLTGAQAEEKLEAAWDGAWNLDGSRWCAGKIGDAATTVRRNNRRLRQDGLDVTLAYSDAGAVWAALLEAGFHPLGLEALDRLRVLRGIPRDGLDMGDENIPLESDYLTEDIDWDKGCYIGQEVIAMMHYRGRPNRHLRGLQMADGVPLPTAGSPLFNADGKEVGRTGTATALPDGQGTYALAVIKRAHADAGTALRLSDGTDAAVVSLPLGDTEAPGE